jgi:uncharacterized membrane protein
MAGAAYTRNTMFDAIVLWLHILGAVTFIGPQIFLAAIAMPAIRSIEDLRVRQDVTRKITRGFGMIGGAALALLLVTGLWNFSVAQDDGKFDITRYFWIFNIKFLLFIAIVLLTGLHAMVLGRRLQDLQERGAPAEEIARVRQQSMMVTMATLTLSLLALLFAALLGSSWALEGGLRD